MVMITVMMTAAFACLFQLMASFFRLLAALTVLADGLLQIPFRFVDPLLAFAVLLMIAIMALLRKRKTTEHEACRENSRYESFSMNHSASIRCLKILHL